MYNELVETYCEDCRVALVQDCHTTGFCACECHVTDEDLAYLKHREGE